MPRLRVVTLFLRRLAVERPAAIGVAVVVLVTAVVFGAAPRLLARAADDALRDTVVRYPVASRNLQLDQRSRIAAATDDPLAGVEAAGGDLQSRLPESIAATIGDRVASADTTRWSVVSGQPLPPVLTIRWEPREFEHIRFVEGSAPTGVGPSVVVPATPTDPEGPSPVYEIAMARPSADKIGAHVGDTIYLRADRTDPDAARVRVRAAVRLVGIYDVANPDDPFWYGEPALIHPTVRAISGEIQYPDVFALAAAPAYPAYLAATSRADAGRNGALPLRYRWRLFVDPARLSAAATGQMLVDLRRLESLFPAGSAARDSPVVSSSLLDILTLQDAQWRSALAVLTVMAIGPASVAIAAVGLVALLTAQRRRATVALWRARGASIGQVGTAVVGETLLVVLPAAVIGGAIAALLVPGGPAAGTVAAVALVALVAALLVIATVVPVMRGAVNVAGASRAATATGPGNRRRIVFEAALVAGAVAAVWLLRDRSVHATGGSGAVGIDPLVAAAPALAGVAAGLLSMRLVLVPMSVAARAAGSGRGLVLPLALRRATRGGAGTVVLLVLLATAMIGAFSSAALVQLERSADAVSWHDVGAPFRLTAHGSLPAALDPSQAGAQAASGAYRATIGAGSSGVRLVLLALDPAAYADLVRGLPVDPAVPPELLGPADAASGGILPALVSTSLVASGADVRVGGTFSVVVDGRQTTIRPVAIADAYPTLAPGTAWVVVSRPQLEAVRRARLDTTDLFVAGPDALAGPLRDLVDQAATGAVVISRTEEAGAVRDSPIVRTVGSAVTIAALIAAGYAALAVAAGLALASAARTGETAILRTFGLSRRDAIGLVVAEHGPIVALAFGVGIAIGLGLFLVLRPGLGLAGIVGSNLDVPLAVEPVHLVLLLALVVIIASVGIALGAAIQRRALLAAAVRRGVE